MSHISKIKWSTLAGTTFVLIMLLSALIGPMDPTYKRTDATGLKPDQAKHFLYFYSTLGLYPLAYYGDVTEQELSTQHAKELAKAEPDKLRMELNHWYRFGEHSRIYALFPSWVLTKDLDDVSLLPFNAAVWSITLLVFFIAIQKTVSTNAALCVTGLLIGHKFILHETFQANNILALTSLMTIFVFSASLLTLRRKRMTAFAFTALIGCIIAFMNDIRGEVAATIVIPILGWLLLEKHSAKSRALGISVLLLTFFISTFALHSFHQHLFKKTTNFVASVEGHVYRGRVATSHPIGVPLLAGLGDFGKDKGFLWSDIRVKALVSKFAGRNYKLKNRTEYYDQRRAYYKRFEHQSGFSEAAFGLFTKTLIDDPFWYCKILMQRIGRIFAMTAPQSFMIGERQLDIPYPGIVVLLVCLVYYFNQQRLPNRQEWFFLLAGFAASASAFVIFSGRGVTFAAVYYVPIYALIISWADETALKAAANRTITSIRRLY